MYPEFGPLRRELYGRHMDFFRLGAAHRERLFLAANRIGKTEGAGGYETTLHLTGHYPPWWEGRRFDRPVRVWIAGKTNETTRDILQAKMLGHVQGSGTNKRVSGTGLIPAEAIAGRPTWKQGIPDLVDTIQIKHASGGTSTLGIKCYKQGRGSFEGTEQDVIWLDEEPPMDIYSECLVRTMTTQGLILLTFTPLEGLSDVVMSFLPDGDMPDTGILEHAGRTRKAVVMATWDDVPHLSAQDKAELLAGFPPYQRDARSKGIPALGSGVIYPVPESDYLVDPFQLPAFWPRAYGFDVGWNRTAAIWGAWDRDTDTVYLYSEHYRAEAEPSVHADAIRGRGDWVPGAIDPAARGRSQDDGKQLLQNYLDLGLNINPADNSVEAGIYLVWQRLSAGRLKVFRSLSNWLMEARLYRRDEKGRIVKERDHLMDATRYLITTGLLHATTPPRDIPNVSGHAPLDPTYGY